ncbi:cell division protein SepF [Lacticigenium naphthae]|uniref:cell division protein SepF n=1 Tax=Lacticigenium naphthae TaxID=515351 RepID=UPI0003FE9A1E|nr:cell division protein SepF [Lacticigenium naphthae]
MDIKNKLNSFFYLEEDAEDFIEEAPSTKEKNERKDFLADSKKQFSTIKNDSKQKKAINQIGGGNVVTMNNSSPQKPKIKVVEPRTYSEVQDIADLLLDNQSVVLNFRRIEKNHAKKIVDFLMGTVYAIKGDIQRIGDEIFICTPQSVEMDGDELEQLSNEF